MYILIGVRASKVGRITGLDPADPNFQGYPNSAKLDKSDADFVDVIHSDASYFLVSDGFGTSDPSGHLDFWPNGGEHQPQCHLLKNTETNAGLMTEIAIAFSCDHHAAIFYFIESINSACSFIAKPCRNYNRYLSGKCTSCFGNPCPIMGYNAVKFKNYNYHNLPLFLKTNMDSPYCGKLTTVSTAKY